MTDEFNPDMYELNNEEYNSFIKLLKGKETSEIEIIIIRYISYKPEMAEAALYVAVDRGIMSYDLKEKITEQVRLNYSKKSKYVKQLKWEKNNAFHDFTATYSDEKIYEIIDNPSDIVIDVFHAVLSVARERELISEKDFNDLFDNAIKASRSDSEIFRDDLNEMSNIFEEQDPELTDEQIEMYQGKYWKCPACKELVENEFDICWKCQAEKPQNVERPQKQEIINEMRTSGPHGLIRPGFALIAGGILVFLFSFVRHYSRSIPWNERYFTLAFSGILILAGTGIIVLGIIEKNKENKK